MEINLINKLKQSGISKENAEIILHHIKVRIIELERALKELILMGVKIPISPKDIILSMSDEELIRYFGYKSAIYVKLIVDCLYKNQARRRMNDEIHNSKRSR